MRTTHIKFSDYDRMLKFAKNYIGKPTLSCIEDFAKKYKIVEHRAAIVFWNLADEEEIVVKRRGELHYIESINNLI